MHKSATKCNETVGKWCKNKHEASKIMDTLETYQRHGRLVCGAAGEEAREEADSAGGWEVARCLEAS
jgi:hypothetical protein